MTKTSLHNFLQLSNWRLLIILGGSAVISLVFYFSGEKPVTYLIAGVILLFLLLASFTLSILLKLKSQHTILEKQKEGIQSQTKELVQLGEDLFAMNEEKNRTLQVLSHDLRNPISQVMVIASLLKSSMDELTKDEQKKLLNGIIQASEKQISMIETLLDISAIEAGKIKPKVEVVNLLGSVNKVIQAQTLFANAKDLNINLNVRIEKTEVMADAKYLYQVFENLLSNAIKYSPPGKQIYIELTESDNNIVASFIDEGPGIKKEEVSKLFKTFSKLSSRPTAGESSIGLGLSLVKNYVKLMGGNVGYIHREQGAHFFVSLSKPLLEIKSLRLEQ